LKNSTIQVRFLFLDGVNIVNTKNSLENVRKLLEKHGQSHLLGFWADLDAKHKQHLLEQIQQLDLTKIDTWVANHVKKPDSGVIRGDLVPIWSYGCEPSDPEQKLKYTKAIELGHELIRWGKVAAFVVAGGQGTRLGFDGPKGNFPISPIMNKTLFRIFAETISAVSAKYETICPWYIMTSPLNFHQTEEIFKLNNYYGLEKDNIFIFEQGTLPNFSSDGKILLANEANISCSPDGHGGSLRALYESGVLKDMEKRGVEFLSYWQVDNALINIFDPLFIGLHVIDKAEMSSKALIKTNPFEKVGNFCVRDGKLHVIEYTEFNQIIDKKAPASSDKQKLKLAERRNSDGSLVFNLGSIAIHIINRTFIEKFNSGDISLPLHRAEKDILHIDENGNPIESKGIKLESFIFDALPLASKSIVLETIRSEEFAPTKNLTGIDSAESARQMIIDRAANWLESAGVKVPRKPDGSADCIIEIAPSFALNKEDIKSKLKKIPPIKPKDIVYLA
jgi:UDP-N-acetylglucosamine/UDP-N-acetylgalactosamine diphosphorylase